MSQFEYLSVLVSIILGLAITRLLSGAARLIQLRQHVRMHATTLCWMAMLFLLDIQVWWALFDRRDTPEWNFFGFTLYLLMPIIVFLLSTLVLPELGDEDEVDLAAHFAGNRPWFFGLLATMVTVSLAEAWLRDGAVPVDDDLAFHVAFFTLAVVGAWVRSARFHLWNAVVALALICGYIGWLFMTLR